MSQYKNSSFLLLLQWSLIALASAVVGNCSVHVFLFLFRKMTAYLSSLSSVPVVFWPVAAAVPVGLLVYSYVPSSMGEGIPSYLEGVRKRQGVLSLKETVFKFMASILTLGSFGNGGFLGPVGRMSAGFMSSLGQFCLNRGLSRKLMPLFPVCGMAATVGVLLHSPIGGGIFAVEIILKTNMRYRQLFPAILASTAGVYLTRFLDLEAVIILNAPNSHMDTAIILKILLLTIAAGIAGKLFILVYAAVSRLFKRDHHISRGGRTLFLMIGSAAASLTLLVNPYLLGTSSAVFEALMTFDLDILYGNIPRGLPLSLMIFLLVLTKGMGNILTVGSGMSGGFTGPAILMGLLMGAGFAGLFGISPGSAEYYALMAAGFAGYFASIMNTPIAAAIITVELFGLHYSLPAGLAAVVGYMVNQNHTLYDLALEEREERLEDLDTA